MNAIKPLICLIALNVGLYSFAEEEESSAKVGPNQAVLEANEGNGIKLSPEAIKNLELKTLGLQGTEPWEVPMSARLLSGEEINVYRVRDGFYKRIDFAERRRVSQSMWITSPDLRADDEVVISGVALLRISELAAFGEAPGEHSH